MGLFGPPNVEKLKVKGDVLGLIKALDYEKDWVVRRDAAMALGQIGDLRAVVPLIDALNDGLVRGEAAEALGKIGDPRAVTPLIDRVLRERYAGALVYQKAARALGNIGEPAVQPLIDRFGLFNDEALEAAVSVFPQLVTRTIKSLIANLKDSPSKNKVIGNLVILRSIGAPAVEPLIAVLNDANTDTCREVVKYLGVMHDSRAVSALIAVLNDADAESRRCAVLALGMIGDSRAIDPLIASLKDGDSDVREEAAKWLACFDDPRAADAVAKARPLIKPKPSLEMSEAVRVLVDECAWHFSNAASYNALKDEFSRREREIIRPICSGYEMEWDW